MDDQATPDVALSQSCEPNIAERLRFLQSTAAHLVHLPPSGAGAQVRMIETHMSWVFLVGEHALKLKKTVRLPFLDFSTLQLREFYCREELRLNARLAPGVYLGLMALQWDGHQFALTPDGALSAEAQTLDWLVLMRRLPAARMLDHLIAEQAPSDENVDALGNVLAEFYRGQPRLELDPQDYLRRFLREQRANRDVLLRPQFGLRAAPSALDRLDDALLRCSALLLQRAASGHIVEGHGDLRPEHVCILRPPLIIDCIEFNADLRQVDPFDELVFMGLECEMSGAAWIGKRLLCHCIEALCDAPSPALLHLYAAYRALLRARLAMAHLLDPQPRMPDKWAPLAQRYIERGIGSLGALEIGTGFNGSMPHDCP